MNIGVPAERGAGESRVAATPETVKARRKPSSRAKAALMASGFYGRMMPDRKAPILIRCTVGK